MGKEQGWISLHRKFRENPIYTSSKAVHIWVECLLRASHTKRDFYLKRTKVELEEGQFVMGRKEFGRSINMSGSTAWFWLTRFKADSMIDIKKTSKGSIVTVLNWNKHQRVDTRVDKKKTANRSEVEPNNNDNNDNNLLGKKKRDWEKEVNDLITYWNSISTASPKFEDGIKMKKARYTENVLDAYKKRFAKTSEDKATEDIEIALKNYVQDISLRDTTKGDYSTHRFSLREFLKQDNAYVRFLNM